MKRRSRVRARTGVICPSRFEHEAVRDLARGLGAPMVVSGMGKVRSVGAVHRLHRDHPSLERVLLIGFAGGLSGLKIGELIEPDRVIEQDYCAEPFEKFPNRIRLEEPKILTGSRRAALLTQDRFIKGNPYAGSKEAVRYPRLACDMEGYAVAWSARELGLGCHIVKLISDEADSDADHDFLKACTELKPRLRSTLLACLQKLR